MRPLRLELTGFGPFGGTEVLDFSVLPTDRPFVIGGCTGAGKTTIFDAMTFALYGRLPGRRSKQKGADAVRSDFAEPSTECSVRFEFEAHGRRWRVIRVPAQERRAKRGDRTVSVNATAVLESWGDGAWTAATSGSKEVDRCCEELVGLRVEQFQRVVLLPQGEFARVLDASTDEREDLLRTLFGTAVFADALERLKVERRRIDELLDAADEHCRGRLGRVGEDIDRAAVALEGASDPTAEATAGVTAEPVGGASTSPADPTDPTDPAGLAEVIELERGPGAHPRDEVERLAERIQLLSGAPLARLVHAVEHAREQAELARMAHRDACSAVELLAGRVRLEGILAEFEQRRPRMEHDRAALHAATAADPVVEAVAQRDDRRREAAAAAEAATASQAVALDHLAGTGLAQDAPLTIERVDTLVAELLQSRARLDPAEHDFQRAGEHREEVGRIVQRSEQLLRGLGEDREARERLRGERNRLADRIEEVGRLAARRELAEHHLQEARALVQRRAARDAAAEAAAEAEQDAANAEGAVAEVQRLLTEAEDAAGQEAAVAATEDDGRRHFAAAEARLAAHGRLARLDAAIAAAEVATVDAERTARSTLDAFVGAAAGRLAAELHPGEACPVCGSPEHPAPAPPPEGLATVTQTEVDEARRAAGDALAALAARRQEREELVGEHAGLADDDPAALEEAVRAGQQELRAATQAAVRAQVLSGTINGLLERQATAVEERRRCTDRLMGARLGLAAIAGDPGAPADHDAVDDPAAQLLQAEEAFLAAEAAEGERAEACQAFLELDDHLAGLEQSITGAELEVDSLRSRRSAAEREAELAEAAGRRNCPVGEPAERRVLLDRAIDALREAGEDARRSAAAASRHVEAVATVERHVAESPFADEASAEGAWLAVDRREEMASAIECWQRGRDETAGALRLLADRDLPEDPPDLEGLDEAAKESDAIARRLQQRLTGAETHLRASREELGSLRAALARDEPLRRRAELLARVHAVLGGRNGDQRVTLETWVLRRHLAEVAEAANAHLHRMSHGRFQLALGSDHVRGQAKAGLDLVVLDAFSGRSRRTTSLSGGETFQASLSLALGLADVLTASRAGRRVDALFVDEGFGSLDADSVEQAISVLDGLRSRGAMVGVITHVEAMKEALEVAVEVDPRDDRRGSTIRQRRTLAVA